MNLKNNLLFFMSFKLKSISIGLLSFFSFYSLALLSGCLMGSSYIPFPPWALFFYYVPLWLFTLKHQRLKPILIGAWLCQCIGTSIGFNWVAYSIQEVELLPWPLSLLGFFVFCSFANLHIPLALLFWFASQKQLRKIKSRMVHSVLIPLLLPVYSALSIEYYPMIFEWHFGYTWLYAKWPAVQTAEIWGFQFLNTLTLFFNLLFLIVFQNLKKEFQINNSLFKNKISIHYIYQILVALLKNTKSKNVFVPLILWILFFTGLNFYGQYLKNRWPEPDQKVSVLIVQPNIENQMQGVGEQSEYILSKVLQETTKIFYGNLPAKKNINNTKNTEIKKQKRKQTQNQKNSKEYQTNQSDFSESESITQKRLSLPVDFILWPEGAYPYPIDKIQAKKRADPVQKWASVFNTPLVVSAEGKEQQKHTNSVFVFDQNGQLIQAPYDKIQLMPFGEYVPLEKWFPFLSRLLFEDESFQPGTGDNKVISLNGLNLGFQICYESLFDRRTRSVVHEGADILVNVTNDAWFGNWQEPWQHLYMTSARAIEARLPLIRGTNSGFSAVVSAKGEISSPWILNKNMSWIEKVPYYSQENKKQSLFASWGYYINQWFLWIILILIHILPKIFVLKEK